MLQSVLTGALTKGIKFIQGLIEVYGVKALVLASLMRGMMLFWFAPEETVTIAYVLLAGESIFHVASIVLIAAVSITFGNVFLYIASYWLGERIIPVEKRKTGKWGFFDWLFNKNGKFAVFIFHLVPVIGGAWVAIPSGWAKMRFKDFLVYSFLSVLLYETLIGFGAWYGIELGLLTTVDIPIIQRMVEQAQMLIGQ